MAAELIILMGLQASGKSTFYRERLVSTHVHVSKDLFPNAKRPGSRQYGLVEEALLSGRSVAIDNTNPTLADREALIAQGRTHGARIVGYYFESKVLECLARNATRQGRAQVPEIGVRATLKRLVRPSLAEGFDALFYVRLISDGFDVAPWQSDVVSGG